MAAQRVSIVDILCQDTQHNRFIIEIQVAREIGFTKRAQYYAAKTYIEQREHGIDYIDLKQVIFLAITDFKIFHKKPGYLSHHVMLDKNTHEHDLKDFSFSFLELPKFKKKKSELKSMTEKWAYFLKHATDTEESDLPMIVGDDKIIQRAFNELDRFSWSVEDMRTYDAIDMKQSADRDITATAKATGKAEGKEEKAIEVAKKMLAKGLPISMIVEYTDLSEVEIRALQLPVTIHRH